MANLLLSIYTGANQVYYDYVFIDKTPYFSVSKKLNPCLYHTSCPFEKKLNKIIHNYCMQRCCEMSVWVIQWSTSYCCSNPYEHQHFVRVWVTNVVKGY